MIGELADRDPGEDERRAEHETDPEHGELCGHAEVREHRHPPRRGEGGPARDDPLREPVLRLVDDAVDRAKPFRRAALPSPVPPTPRARAARR